MESGSSSREERRRKILERGSDRMALIFTGRSQSFSSAPPSIDDLSSPSLRRSSFGNYDDLASVSNGYDISSEALERKLKSIKVMLDTTKREIVTAAAAASAASRHNTSMVEPYPALQKHSTDPEPSPKPHRPHLFSSKQLHSCIIESENTRGFCAFIIAVLVVLSYVGYPLFGSRIVRTESIIAARPLYILLLTDISIIMARMLLSAGKDMEEAEQRNVTQEDNSNWDGAVKLLERGLVVYQSIRGIFIDCSVYMVVVVCGLSQI